jgi:putative peptidoglycan lipid II flippase
VGTTVAVASQILVLLPYLKRERFRFRFSVNFKDPAIRMIISLSSWTLGFVIANQLAVFFIMALEVRSGVGGVSAYTYAFTFFQLPFGVIAVSIVNVITPDFARFYSARNPRQFANRFSLGSRQVMALVIPATVGYLILARPIVGVLIGHGQESSTAVHLTAATLVMFALGLPGFCIFFLTIRAFQAMHDTKTAFILYVIENGANIITAIFLYQHFGVKGLALSYSIAYSLGALVALSLLRERLGAIGGKKILARSAESLIYSILMGFVIALVGALFSPTNNLYTFFILILQVACGLLVYLGAASAVRSIKIRKKSL